MTRLDSEMEQFFMRCSMRCRSKRQELQERVLQLHTAMQKSAAAYEEACSAVEGGREYIAAQRKLDSLTKEGDQVLPATHS